MTRFERVGYRGWHCLPLWAALAACSSQVDPQYQGEPIATMHGTVVARQALETDEAVSAAVIWSTGTESSDGTYQPKFIGTRVEVTGSFPARFTLDLFTAPSFDSDSGNGIYVGYLAAIESAAADTEIAASDILGIDTGHMLFYFTSDAPTLDELAADAKLSENERSLLYARATMPLTFNVSGAKGYHLAKLNPAVKALRRKGEECAWKGRCMHMISPDGSDTDNFETEFARCTETFPQNPTCNAWVYTSNDFTPDGDIIPRADEPDWSLDCKMQAAALDEGKSCSWNTSQLENGSAYVDNPDGMADPITIEMGLTLWDYGR